MLVHNRLTSSIVVTHSQRSRPSSDQARASGKAKRVLEHGALWRICKCYEPAMLGQGSSGLPARSAGEVNHGHVRGVRVHFGISRIIILVMET